MPNATLFLNFAGREWECVNPCEAKVIYVKDLRTPLLSLLSRGCFDLQAAAAELKPPHKLE